ncbi:MAG: 4-hydroxy-tetrahydrodipicolinate synthase [Candidatus Aureabacteria bacterium]|nr:4-hydroxy-tetrahydrodipicolinate synthase [Candidatus Auribacterota bacterium]
MLSGSFVATVTPFKDGVLDEKTFRNLLDRQMEAGTTGVVPCGTTGESATLSYEEHKHLIELTVGHVKGKMKVIAGAGSNCTSEAIELARHAEGSGADAVLVITPYYNKPTQKGMILHFEAVAKSITIPLVVYNVPGRTGVSIDVDTLAELNKIPNITAIKEASGSVDRVSAVLGKTSLTVLSGDDSLTFPMMMVGAKGVISVTANVVPKLVAQMVDAALKGDVETGRKIHHQLFGLSSKLFLETNPLPAKAALAKMGLIQNELRLPLCPMSSDKFKILEDELVKMKLV